MRLLRRGVAMSSRAPVFPAPVNQVLPVISGTPSEGSLLTSTTGTWIGNSLVYTYQWQDDAVDIGGATSSTYTVTGLTIGHSVTCDVTATDDRQLATLATSNTLVVTAVADDYVIYSNITIY